MFKVILIDFEYRKLFLINRQLEILKRDITLYSDKVKASLKIVGAARQIDLREMDESQVQFARKRAGRIIKRAILSKQTKEQILTNPYFAFLSMIDKDDAQLQLSAIMFGRHVAELRIDARERIDNPLINITFGIPNISTKLFPVVSFVFDQ